MNTIEDIKSKIIPALQDSGVTKAAVFGSFARGEVRPDSDLDLLIEIPKGKSLFDIGRLKVGLESLLNRSVDLVEYAAIKPLIRATVLKEQVSLY